MLFIGTLMALPRTPWLDAWADRLASLDTNSANLRFVDVRADGDSRMVVGNRKTNKLKVFQGTTLEAELPLPDMPTALAAFTPPSSSGTSKTRFSQWPAVATCFCTESCGLTVSLLCPPRP